MSAHHFVTLDVFTSTPFGGNQLAVFPDARAIPDASLLAITREFNYSEVTFCYPPTNPAHTKRVRIFTPGGELPFAGHPTVGTAVVLHLLGQSAAAGNLVLEEGVGPVPVSVHATGDGAAFAQFSVASLPIRGPDPLPLPQLAEVLSLGTDDIQATPFGPQNIVCGIRFLLVPLCSVNAVSRARIRLERWESLLKGGWAPEVFVFAKDPAGGPAHFRARMFAPGINVAEDPATGSANACFAGYLAAHAARPEGTLAWTVDQGIEMGRPSRLEIEADKVNGTLTAVRVGGSSVLVSEGTLRVP